MAVGCGVGVAVAAGAGTRNWRRMSARAWAWVSPWVWRSAWPSAPAPVSRLAQRRRRRNQGPGLPLAPEAQGWGLRRCILSIELIIVAGTSRVAVASGVCLPSGRGGQDRTGDLLLPKQARFRCATPRRGFQFIAPVPLHRAQHGCGSSCNRYRVPVRTGGLALLGKV